MQRDANVVNEWLFPLNAAILNIVNIQIHFNSYKPLHYTYIQNAVKQLRIY